MAKVLQRTLGADDDLPGYTDPYAQQIEAMRRKLAQPAAPMYSPEEVQQRRDANQQQYALGLLGQLSGNEQLGGVGGQIFKQALAARQPRVTERGVADPLSGEFKYSPDYLRAQDEARLAGMENKSAAARANYDSQRIAAQERRQRDADNAAYRMELRASMGGGGPLVSVIGPDGQPVYVPRSQAAGLKPAPTGGGNATEGERNAAGFAAMMRQAAPILAKFENTGRATIASNMASAIPLIGNAVALAQMTPDQQRYYQAAQQWVRAKLRRESGATIGDKEMAEEIRTFFPQPGESQGARMQKAQARAMAEQSLIAAAGRAQVPGLPGSGGDQGGGASAGPAAAGAPPSNRYRVDF